MWRVPGEAQCQEKEIYQKANRVCPSRPHQHGPYRGLLFHFVLVTSCSISSGGLHNRHQPLSSDAEMKEMDFFLNIWAALVNWNSHFLSITLDGEFQVFSVPRPGALWNQRQQSDVFMYSPVPCTGHNFKSILEAQMSFKRGSWTWEELSKMVSWERTLYVSFDIGVQVPEKEHRTHLVEGPADLRRARQWPVGKVLDKWALVMVRCALNDIPYSGGLCGQKGNWLKTDPQDPSPFLPT